jgi:phytoene dehydrogenase-like protein
LTSAFNTAEAISFIYSKVADAVVIGAGHNGLVAAAMLAGAGWDVLVLEAQAETGGAVKSAELISGTATRVSWMASWVQTSP